MDAGAVTEALISITAPRSRCVPANRALVMVAVLAAMFMVSIETTIVATAVPQIVADLGGLHLYSWIFVSFLLTQTSATVVFGKLADVYGRKPVMLAGIGIFLVGSILCGFAWSMTAMIAFRLIQGIGAGAVQPIALTIVGDLFPGRERGRVQGYLASVWAISAVSGPIIGALIVRETSWAWIFWINVPLGLASALGFVLFLKGSTEVRSKPIDVIGAMLFTMVTATLMVGLTALSMPQATPLLIIGTVLAVGVILFIRQERRALDPVLSFQLWSSRAIATTNGVAVLGSMALMGITSFLPIYIQGVLRRTPVEAGLALTMTMVGWPLGATIAARSFPRFGLRQVLTLGASFVPVGAGIFVLLSPSSSPIVAGAGSFVMGIGMGLISVSSLVLVQEVAEGNERGSATASVMFSRNLGSALGAASLGTVLNYNLRSYGDRSIRFGELETAFGGVGSHVLDPRLSEALQYALHATFLAVFIISVAIVLLALLVPDVAMRSKPSPAA
ncbi:MFS transporter (plasmid) [Polymorphobacter sp. PAMC 29334]|uniref:MDR family MFS transporter n=1 Tax=Polymorphobacter sp. PAMC 29334 TaxID=2862331 RepID=UPI001C682B1F|nr:MDR family MFS transporter [Polymorphobacter sp. PAMC 29334]QYE33569.1 MFS transporter [Polymorphobacter sp. PAMC 29334]